MKKLLACALVSLLALTACSSQPANTESKTFTVGMEAGYQPFNWQTAKKSKTTVALDSGSGYADGYDVQIASRIAKSLNKKLVIKKISWDGLQPALESGEIDAIIAGMTANKEREQGIDFTSPYYSSEMVMIVQKDSDMTAYTDIQQFTNRKVMGQKNTNYDTIIDQIKGVKHQTPLATYPELVVALNNGDAEAITAELPVANGIVQANPNLAIVHFEKGHNFDVDITVSIGMREGSRGTKLFKSVQKALNQISDQERLDIMEAAVKRAPTND